MSIGIDVCGHCCAWANDARDGGPSAIIDTYPGMMREVLGRLFHMPEKAADEFIEDACSGNWERMHLTRPEDYLTSEQWAKHLLNEVIYFSDRWSWDRVIRAQWIYKRLCDRHAHDVTMSIADGCVEELLSELQAAASDEGR